MSKGRGRGGGRTESLNIKLRSYNKSIILENNTKVFQAAYIYGAFHHSVM